MIAESLKRKVIQGGMGAGVSWYPLAKEVSTHPSNEGLGVVSGVGLDTIIIRRLQKGDPTGDIRFALRQFPDQEFAEEIIDKYYIPGGKGPEEQYKHAPFPTFKLNSDDSLSLDNAHHTKLIVAANFVEVYLAKLGHDNPIGINYMYKVRYAIMPSIYGAMLAGVDALMIGAGFAKDIPDALTALTENRDATLPIDIADDKPQILHYNPEAIFNKELKRPVFFGILATEMGLRGLPNADAHVFEGPDAAGHNARARSKLLNARGEPLFGKKDYVDYKLLKNELDKIAQNTGSMPPYWLAGNYPRRLGEAQEHGAVGVQAASLFALCNKSGQELPLILKILQQIKAGREVFTSPDISPSGFPFKVFQCPNTFSDPGLYNARKRVCDLGYLVELYTRDGKTRCPAEDILNYMKKGGLRIDTLNKGCLCNWLLANVGYGSPGELPIITLGSDLSSVKAFINKYNFDYSVNNVMNYILNNGVFKE